MKPVTYHSGIETSGLNVIQEQSGARPRYHERPPGVRGLSGGSGTRTGVVGGRSEAELQEGGDRGPLSERSRPDTTPAGGHCIRAPPAGDGNFARAR